MNNKEINKEIARIVEKHDKLMKIELNVLANKIMSDILKEVTNEKKK